MRVDWRPIDEALERYEPTFWWRDDDAVEPTPALDRLVDLTERTNAPLLLAAISAHATEALAKRVAQHQEISVAPHGWTHENHASAQEKTAEFGAHRPVDVMAKQAAQARLRIETLFGKQAVPIFVPPWNRLAGDMPSALRKVGYLAYSTYAHREIEAHPIPRIDTHIDPINWRGNRSAVDPDKLVFHIAGLIKNDAPIGLMTHHLVHDEAIWSLTEALVSRLTDRGARWIDVRTLLNPLELDTK